MTPQVDLQLESGEYFLKQTEKEAREIDKRNKKVRLPESPYVLSND